MTQPVLTVVRHVKCPSSLHKVNQLDVQIVSTRTNLREVLVAEMATEAETEVVLAVTEAVTEDSIVETVGPEKCIKQNVPAVETNAKCHSNQLAKSQFIVEIALEIIN